jgi:hypothetical protein
MRCDRFNPGRRDKPAKYQFNGLPYRRTCCSPVSFVLPWAQSPGHDKTGDLGGAERRSKFCACRAKRFSKRLFGSLEAGIMNCNLQPSKTVFRQPGLDCFTHLVAPALAVCAVVRE